jgi:hypothetical protein
MAWRHVATVKTANLLPGYSHSQLQMTSIASVNASLNFRPGFLALMNVGEARQSPLSFVSSGAIRPLALIYGGRVCTSIFIVGPTIHSVSTFVALLAPQLVNRNVVMIVNLDQWHQRPFEASKISLPHKPRPRRLFGSAASQM